MENFIQIDPGVTVDLIPGRIRHLEARNALLTVCVIASVAIAAYYAYKYYEASDEWV